MLSPKVVRMPSPVQTPRNLADIVHRNDVASIVANLL